MDFELVVARGKASSKKIKLKGPRVTIGRGTECNLRLSSQKVSRKHCEIVEQDGALAIRDLDSSNGTYVNNEKVDEEQALQPGDELAIGPIRFVVQYQADADVDAAAAPAKKAAAKPAAAKLETISDDEEADDDILDDLDLKIKVDDDEEKPKKPAAQPKPAAKAKKEEKPKPAKAKKEEKPKPAAKAKKKEEKPKSDEDLAAMLLGLGDEPEDEDEEEESVDRPTEQFKFNTDDK